MNLVDQEWTQKFIRSIFKPLQIGFFEPSLVCSVKIRKVASFSVSYSFWSRGTDDQEWRIILIHSIVKPFPIDFSTQNWYLGWKSDQLHRNQFQTLFDQEEPVIKNGWTWLIKNGRKNSFGATLNPYISIFRSKFSLYGEN